ncbi:hypothetical protein CALVIDRAFT_533570 [Calocera viscosa TUFC12733]|uniref:Uncharacterized protein n=1 Tax=Calocera viscosa (strain TUFC12733) TaxID=1330018 RepID=A0A167R591_CALVF|nr:hypothetical protein CALVIDRAFT_533570 [Calocera viscosa TUFC12733]
MASQRRLGVSPSSSRPSSMVDLPGQLEAVFNEWPSRSYNQDDVPIVLGSDIPDVLLLWSQQYNDGIPLLDMNDESVKQIFETEHIRNFQLTPEQVYRLVTGLLETMERRGGRDIDDEEVSMLMSTDDDELPSNVHLNPPTPGQIPLPVSAGSEKSSPDELVTSDDDGAPKSRGHELFGADLVMSTPAKSRIRPSHSQELEKFQFPSPEKPSAASQAALARLRTTSNPETPPRKPKVGHKVYESRGDVPSAPSSWRHVKPAAPSKRRLSQSGRSSHDGGSDTEDTFASHQRAPSDLASPRSAASVLSPVGILQELDSFPMGRGQSLHSSLSAPSRSIDFYHDPSSDPRFQLQEGDSMLELDMDSFHDMEANFATNPDVMPGDVSITRLYAYIRTCTRMMNQSLQKAQDSEAEMKKSERDRMMLSDDLDEARQQAAQMKRESENLLQQINALNQSITAFEVNAANKDHELRRVHDKLHDRDRELQHNRTTIESFKHTVALKDDEIARLKESETELHSQVAEEEHNIQALQAKHASDLIELKKKLQDADERSMDLRDEIKSLMHEKDTENSKLQTAEAELTALRTSHSDSSKKTRLSSNKSPLSNEFVQEETDDGTLIDDQSAAESTDADNETFVTHTVITRRKQPRKSAGKAGPASMQTEIEQSRTFAEIAIQSEPLEHSATTAIQTEAPPKVVDTDMQTDGPKPSETTTEAPTNAEIVALTETVYSDEPFPSSSLLSNAGRKATQTETQLERKLLLKWHEHLSVPIEGLAKGITDNAVAEWEALKQETGRGCTAMDQLLERSKKIGPRPGSKKAAVATSESASELNPASAEAEATQLAAKQSSIAVKALPAHSFIHQIITTVYPGYQGELDAYIDTPYLKSLTLKSLTIKSLTLNRTTLLWIMLIISIYTFFILHWAAVLNPAAYYPGLSYRDRALWNSYHQYAYHRRYGAPRMARTSAISDPFTKAWYHMVDWVTSG